MNKFSFITFLSLIATHPIASEKISVGIGDQVCLGGYIMDTYCIELGVLFDNPSIRTLGPDGPTKHSVHCLVDVGRCKNSPFEILSELEDGSFARAWRVDNNDLLLSHAKVNGVCSDCEPGNSVSSGHLERGYRAAVNATVKSLGDGNVPAVISVNSVSHFSEFDNLCGGVEYEVPSMVIEEMVGGGGRNLVKIFVIHGILMIIGWGLLLPSGILIAKFGKHRPDAWWFKMHMIFQPIGLLIAIIGWIIALVNFTTFEAGPGASFSHAVLGSVTMAIALNQAVNGILRPHVNSKEEGEEKTTKRKVWELFHRGLGWVGLFLSIITIGLGTTLIPAKKDQQTFQIVYGVLLVGLFVLLPGFLYSEKDKYNNTTKEEDEQGPEKA